jgi:hypothetical protein
MITEWIKICANRYLKLEELSYLRLTRLKVQFTYHPEKDISHITKSPFGVTIFIAVSHLFRLCMNE